MTAENVFSIAVFILLPLSGLFWFVRICRNMYSRKLQDPPVLKLFFLFLTYGGLLLTFLTTFMMDDVEFGIFTFGGLYLLLVAPMLMAAFAVQLKQRRHDGQIIRIMYRASWLYFLIAPAIMLLATMIVNMTTKVS